jgi:hypothetical protein
MYDVVERIAPGHVVSWTQPGLRQDFTYVAYLAPNEMFYTTATEHNDHVAQVLTRLELAELLTNGNFTLYLAVKWEAEDP